MNLFVLGASGRTGSEIVDLALARGHCVTAFVRSPDKIQRRDQGLRVVAGDPRRAEQVAAALTGHDAVLSAIGPGARDALLPSTLLCGCALGTTKAMELAGVRRLGIVSAALLFEDTPGWFAPLKLLIRHHLRDLRAMENVVRATALDWTIARPPRLTRSAADDYRSARAALPAGRMAMSFRAVASFLLDNVERGSHPREIVGLAG